MKCYDEELRRLSEQCARRKRLGALAWELEEQCRTYSARAQELKECLEKEQADVDRLEEGSLSAFFYNVMGKMDEKKAKEESELYAARLKYQNAVRELEQARGELESCRNELDALMGCEERYANLFREKTAPSRKPEELRQKRFSDLRKEGLTCKIKTANFRKLYPPAKWRLNVQTGYWKALEAPKVGEPGTCSEAELLRTWQSTVIWMMPKPWWKNSRPSSAASEQSWLMLPSVQIFR